MTDSSLEHRSRYGWLGRPVVWRLQGTTLSMVGKDNDAASICDLREIRELRLYLMPARFWQYYVCELRLADGRMLRIGDEYTRFVVWRVLSRETYGKFVAALCAKLVSAGVPCRFRAGPPEASYLFVTLAAVAAIYGLTQFMVSQVGMSETDGRWAFAFGCALALLKSPYWHRVNRLVEFDPAEIPDGLLPRDVAFMGARS